MHHRRVGNYALVKKGEGKKIEKEKRNRDATKIGKRGEFFSPINNSYFTSLYFTILLL